MLFVKFVDLNELKENLENSNDRPRS